MDQYMMTKDLFDSFSSRQLLEVICSSSCRLHVLSVLTTMTVDRQVCLSVTRAHQTPTSLDHGRLGPSTVSVILSLLTIPKTIHNKMVDSQCCPPVSGVGTNAFTI